MTKKILTACFDVVKGRVTKAVQFQDNIDVAPAEEMAVKMMEAGIDELIFFDVFASAEKRPIDIEMVGKVAARVSVPFTVGGGLKTMDDLAGALKAGADKISIDSMAVRNPQLINDASKEFGARRVVLSTQVKREAKMPSGYEVYIDAAKLATGMDAVEWIKRAEELGAGEICVNSIDCDGTLKGYDLELMEKAYAAVSLPLIASGGAGKPEHLKEVFENNLAQSAIISSMLYSPRMERNYTVRELKEYLSENGINVRPWE
jgi:cyclase